MATPNEKLAESLEKLKELQDAGFMAIKSSELSRVHRERLMRNGFLKEVVKGWYLSISTFENQGDSTSWYASYWHFCDRYLSDRFSKDYCISPEQSILIHTGNWTVPQQLLVRSKKGTNSATNLPYGTSLFSIKSPILQKAEIQKINGINVLSLISSLTLCSPSFYISNANDARTALSLIRNSSEILATLLTHGNSTIAGRIAGAFRNIGQTKIADEIVRTMKATGYDIRESDPFDSQLPFALSNSERSPCVTKIKLMWNSMRESIIKNFPPSPGIPSNIEDYLTIVDSIYTTDAYHSLSIERYQVTQNLIERVKSGNWDIQKNKKDIQQRDAMAARGYWQATKEVRKSLIKILNGQNPGTIADYDHANWYRELFAPSVLAGLIQPSDLAGYRNNPVFIGQSKHMPLDPKDVRETMPVLFELLNNETEASVRAVLGHFIFVYIHPYIDGNGRMARFIFNAMLASGGYPWTVIPLEMRDEYMTSLEIASVENNIEPFSKLLGYLVEQTLKGKPIAN